jgi:hypothetical protein
MMFDTWFVVNTGESVKLKYLVKAVDDGAAKQALIEDAQRIGVKLVPSKVVPFAEYCHGIDVPVETELKWHLGLRDHRTVTMGFVVLMN